MELDNLSTPSEGIALETQEGTAIENDQSRKIWKRNVRDFQRYEEKYGDITSTRTEPDALYNCHGLTFASRRTWVYDNDDLKNILEDDNYGKVEEIDVLSGDIILYIGNSGDIEHSGVVVKTPSPDEVLRIPIICSKWGKYSEVIHRANQCPYNYDGARYYRKNL